MASLIYVPQIRCHVETTSGILDISNDLVNWSMTLRENAPHTFSFTLQNAQRKYDGRLLPMDRISVGLKRINWLQNFTGYLNDGPIFQAWPGTLPITATCTLKLPQFHYWDPNTVEAVNLLSKYTTKVTTATDPTKMAADSLVADTTLRGAIVGAMTQVLKWPAKQIHIGAIPPTWWKLVSPVIQDWDRDTGFYEKLATPIVGAAGSADTDATLGGESTGAIISLPAGNYGGTSLDRTQAGRASQIYSAIKVDLKTPQDAIVIMALMCAMQESGIKILSNSSVPSSAAIPHDGTGSDHDSCGLYQQRVPMWGPASVTMNVLLSTKLFVNSLKKNLHGNLNPPESSYGSNVQDVQGSQFPTAYTKWLPMAKAVVAKANALAAAKPNAATPTPGATASGASANAAEHDAATGTAPAATGVSATIGAPRAGYYATGSQMAKVAFDLIKAHGPGKSIIYSQSARQNDNTPSEKVKYLDCSALSGWCYYHATGRHLVPGGFGDSGNVAAQRPKCKIIPLDLARHIQGALLFNGTEHVGVSLGSGDMHVAAHMQYSDVVKDVDISPIGSSQFDSAGLINHIDYSSSATTQAALAQLNAYVPGKLTLAPALAGVSVTPGEGTDGGGGGAAGTQPDAFVQTINALVLGVPDLSGSVLGGPVALINDQPFLPWLQNLVSASLRSFCSAPNGDFIAWFPDYFGNWGTGAIMNIEPIELQDFTVSWSDQQIVTHQFVLGNPNGAASMLDQLSGSVGYLPSTETSLIALAMQATGGATLDYPEVMEAIYGRAVDKGTVDAYLQRFGGRPDVVQMPALPKGMPEKFMAMYLFMQRWAAQFTAQVPTTFMPELWPGMLLRIPEYDFQAYVQGVTHSGNYGEGGGFTTTVDICAPSYIGKGNTTLSLLPRGGVNLS